MYYATKKKVHALLQPDLDDTKWDKIINAFIITLIILNVIAVMLETVPSIHEEYENFFRTFDLVSVIIFSVEYLLRVWSCTIKPKYSQRISGRLRYMISAFALIDLLAILPFYFHFVMGLDLRVLRIFRLLFFLRLLRLTAYMKAAKMVMNVFKKRGNELKLSIVLILFLIIILASVVYFAEHNAQPETFSSIPSTLWWAVVTVTSVGYGDMVPVTTVGKTLTGIIALFGLAFFALPAGIITAGFLEEMRKVKATNIHKCPHCGESIDDHEHHDF